jgi:hypothetical protein
MGRTNDKTDVDSAMLRDLSQRISNCVKKFDEVAGQLESREIESLPLALDTFKKVALERLEAFSRTIEREFIRACDVPRLKKQHDDEEILKVAEDPDRFATNVGKPKKSIKQSLPSKSAKKHGS